MKKILLLIIFYVGCSFPAGAQGTLDTGLVASYPFNGNATDESVFGNHGTVNGSILTTDRFGNPNSAYFFNGISDVISIPHSNSLDITEEISLVAWINVESKLIPYLGRIIIKNPGPDNIVFGMFLGSPNYIFAQLEDINNNITQSLSTNDSIIEELKWEFLVTTWDGDSLKIYVNCDLIAAINTNNIEVLTSTFSEVTIGNSDDPGELYGVKGKIDDVRIYNRALAKSEISLLGSCAQTTGITHIENTFASVYPNPTNDQLYIKGLPSGSILKLYNSLGENISSMVLKGNSIDITTLESGTYIIQASSNGRLKFSSKFIKI